MWWAQLGEYRYTVNDSERNLKADINCLEIIVWFKKNKQSGMRSKCNIRIQFTDHRGFSDCMNCKWQLVSPELLST